MSQNPYIWFWGLVAIPLIEVVH